MSFMYAGYQKIRLPQTQNFPSQIFIPYGNKYQTYLYRESGGGSEPSSIQYRFPVVFVHGHKGDYKQCRSLANAAFINEEHEPRIDNYMKQMKGFFFRNLFRTAKSGTKKNKKNFIQQKIGFDVYCVDFDDEMSGFHGAVLERQSNYLKHVLQYVATVYKDRVPPMFQDSFILAVSHRFF